ncbi:FAD-binding oxidoreductase [Neobacillus sp. SM06]|uniref:FAD-binding oxidoreductase n=1 Tax=Neobacillus sp. SM06 TaxID=3422492 RepID=UPI003D27C1AD
MIVADLMTGLQTVIPKEQMEDGKSNFSSLGNNGHIIVYPKTEQEISDLLKYANDNGKTITIAGAGTKRGFGGVVESADILLSLKYYTGIIEHSVGDMIVTVKAGTKFNELQDTLLLHHQKIPLDPAWASEATIGGIVAANDSGPKRLGYGSARDLVIGMRIVYPDGTIIRTGGKTVKNVAGYDMNKLFIGAMGTLGVISEITLKLRPQPKFESLILLAFPNGKLDKIRDFAVKLLDSAMEPVSLEAIGPSLAEKLTGNANYIVAISFEDVESSVRYQEEFVRKNLPDGAEMVVFEQDEAAAFWQRFTEISPNGLRVKNENATEASLKIGVKNLDVLNVIKQSTLLQDPHQLKIEAHGGLGHGIVHINLIGASQDVIKATSLIRTFVASLGGYTIIKHLPFVFRKEISVWGEKPPYFFLLEGIKAKVDPNRTLNTKRFVGGI